MVNSENNGAAGKVQGGQQASRILAVLGLGSAANVKLSTAKPGDSRANFGSGVPKPSFDLK